MIFLIVVYKRSKANTEGWGGINEELATKLAPIFPSSYVWPLRSLVYQRSDPTDFPRTNVTAVASQHDIMILHH